MSVYTSDGNEVLLPAVSMVAGESKLVELAPVLQAAGLGHQALGWIKLGYSGVVMEMGAQLTLYPSAGGSAVDSPRSLDIDYKSTKRDAVFRLPNNGVLTLALTNSSSANITVRQHCGLSLFEFPLAPKATHIETLQANDMSLPLHVDLLPVACEIQYDGPVSAIRATGLVKAGTYAAPIRFYDPKTATSPNLTAVG